MLAMAEACEATQVTPAALTLPIVVAVSAATAWIGVASCAVA